MRNKAHDLANYNFSKGEVLLLDANVWLYLFPAPSDTAPSYTTGYSRALKRMMTAGAQLALDALILSEYLNRYCRIEFSARNTGMSFKQFRNSPNFTAVGKTAVSYTNRMLQLCKRYDHPFASTDMPQLLSNFEMGVCDLNDGLLVDVCRQNGWKLVTNDGDFTEGGIEVLTINHKLLGACK